MADAGAIQASQVHGVAFSCGSDAKEGEPGLGNEHCVVPLGQGLSLLALFCTRRNHTLTPKPFCLPLFLDGTSLGS